MTQLPELPPGAELSPEEFTMWVPGDWDRGTDKDGEKIMGKEVEHRGQAWEHPERDALLAAQGEMGIGMEFPAAGGAPEWHSTTFASGAVLEFSDLCDVRYESLKLPAGEVKLLWVAQRLD